MKALTLAIYKFGLINSEMCRNEGSLYEGIDTHIRSVHPD